MRTKLQILPGVKRRPVSRPRGLEARYRGQAALALEAFGRNDLAADQWALGTELMPAWSVQKHREFAESNPWSFGEDYEKAYLESDTAEEFSVALERLRSAYESTE